MIILDTHAWIWWASDPAQLSARAKRAIHGAEAIGVCAISCWEVAMLAAKGRLLLDREPLAWIGDALGLAKIELLPLSPSVAVRSAYLDPAFHGDPADRLIAATALLHDAPLVSKDDRLRRWPALKTIW